MQDSVKKYIDRKKEEIKQQRDAFLIEEGMYTKEYAPDDKQSDEFHEYEWSIKENKNRFYKKVAIEITDEEFEMVKELNEKTKKIHRVNNPVGVALQVIAWIIFIGGFIAGIVLGNVEVTKGIYYSYTATEFSFAIAFTYWSVSLISGMLFLGLSEAIKLLNEINNK